MKGNTVYDCTMVELDKHHHEKGNITVVENGITVPFDVKRVYYLYDVPGGETRGGHAHKELYQLMVAASGSFSVILDDGTVKRTFVLNRPYQGAPFLLSFQKFFVPLSTRNKPNESSRNSYRSYMMQIFSKHETITL